MNSTGNKQEPFVYGSLGGADLVLVPQVSVPRSPTSPSDPNAAVRRDYELALQISTIPVWNSFISNYPSGFYTDLAKAQRGRIIAEAASVAATERAKATADEQKRLAVQGAKSTEQAKAAVQTKAAEEARIAAEQEKAIEEAKVAEAERAKAAAQAEHDKTTTEVQTARLTPPAETPLPQTLANLSAPPLEGAMTMAIKKELKRVGCYSGRIDGKWATTDTKESVVKFARYANLASVPADPAADFLDAIRSKSDRICPLECGAKEAEKNGRCVKRREPRTASLEKRELKVSATPSAIKRADQAQIAGTYQKCMGPQSGCYQRAIKKRFPEDARAWCSRQPTC
jgi:hypothetical protein